MIKIMVTKSCRVIKKYSAKNDRKCFKILNFLMFETLNLILNCQAILFKFLLFSKFRLIFIQL